LGREFAHLFLLFQGFALVSPFEGFSHCPVKVINEFEDADFLVELC